VRDAVLADLERRVESRAARAARRVWPSSEYASSPVRFAREVLDRELWDEQAEWVEACARPDARVSVVSGHKTGKSLGEAVVALWAWSTFDPIRVFLFAPKIEHIEKVALWKEIRFLYQNSGRCAACRAREHTACSHVNGIWLCRPVEPCAWCSPIGDAALWNEDSTTGLQSPDGRREILAYTARDVDALGGISGRNMVFVFDEAGGVKAQFFEAMKGNAAGGVRWVMAGNPLHTTGEQYDAHHGKRSLYSHVQEIDSQRTPNVIEGRKVVPGLATREWVEQRAVDWGRDSSAFDIRVRGRFPKYEAGQLLRIDEIAASNQRWYTEHFRGRLQLGVDVAFTGDEAAVAPRRGYKISELRIFRDTSPDALAREVAALAGDLKEPHEQKPIVIYDAQGKTGRDFGAAIRAYSDELELIPVYGNGKPHDQRRYLMRRDELAHELAAWVKRGGALPPDAKLEGEIGRTVAKPVSKTDQRAKVPSNEEIKAFLGRSPDRRNACELACADARAEAPAAQEQTNRRRAGIGQVVDAGDDGLPPDVYGAADAGLRRAWGQQ
jgi:phage terminase large subunit